MAVDSVLINTGRLGLISHDGREALVDRTDLRVAIDDLHLADESFLQRMGTRAIATPHLAGVTVDAIAAIEDRILDAIVERASFDTPDRDDA